MNSNDSYKKYAADCVRLSDGEASPEAKNVMLSIALCWVKLAQQKQALTAAAPDGELRSLEPDVLDESIDAPARTH